MMKVGVLGAGWWAEEHAQAIQKIKGVEITAVNSGSLESAQEYAARFGGKAYADAADIFPEVDVVLITAPHILHRDLAVAAIQAGKPLLLEKPVATNQEDSRAIIGLARESGLPCLIGFTNHYFPGFAKAHELLSSGKLGAPLAGDSVMQKFWMEPNRRDWHLSRERGGGMLLTAGIHALDRLMWLMDKPVQAVSAVTGTHFHSQDADDMATLFLRFEGQRVGTVGSYGYAHGGPLNFTHLLCEQGSLRVTATTLEIGQADAWESVEVPESSTPVTTALGAEWQDFRAWVETGKMPQITPEFALEVMEVLFAAEQSSAECREIPLN